MYIYEAISDVYEESGLDLDLDHAGRRTHHVVEASEEGDVRQTHQLGIVDSKTANAKLKTFLILLFFCST